MSKNRKKAKSGKAAPKQEPVKSSEVTQQISARKLCSLLATARSTYKDVREIAGAFGAEVKNAAEHEHLNKKAFSMVKTLDRMEPEKLADTLDSLDYYLDVSGLRKRASQVQRLPMGGGDEAAEEEHDTEPAREGAKAGNGHADKPMPAPVGASAD
jgi:hypothetical protein